MIKKYSWYLLPATVHKILSHGHQAIEFFDLPHGSYSEQALETSNKFFKKARKYGSRKTSYIDSLTDSMNF